MAMADFAVIAVCSGDMRFICARHLLFVPWCRRFNLLLLDGCHLVHCFGFDLF